MGAQTRQLGPCSFLGVRVGRGAREDEALSTQGQGYSLVCLAPPWLTRQGWQPGCWLGTEGLSTCAHRTCSGCSQLSLREQTLTPGHCAPSSPVTPIRAAWRDVSWSLWNVSNFLNNDLINNRFLVRSQQLQAREGRRPVGWGRPFLLLPWCLKARPDLCQVQRAQAALQRAVCLRLGSCRQLPAPSSRPPSASCVSGPLPYAEALPCGMRSLG